MTATLIPAGTETSEAYHASGAIGSTLIKLFVKNRPLMHATWQRSIPQPKTQALDIGSLFHARYDPSIDWTATYAKAPCDDKRLKAWREAERELESGQQLIRPSDWDLVDRMVAAVHDNVFAASLLVDVEHEVGVRLPDPEGSDLMLQARADILRRESHLADFKTVDDVDRFPRSVTDYGYHLQAALYQLLFEHACGQRLPFLFIAIDKTPTPRCRVYELDETYLSIGRCEVERALADIRLCIRTGNWRDPIPDAVLSPPDWLIRRGKTYAECARVA